MKKVLFFLFAVSALVFASCSKEVRPEATAFDENAKTIIFRADGLEAGRRMCEAGSDDADRDADDGHGMGDDRRNLLHRRERRTARCPRHRADQRGTKLLESNLPDPRSVVRRQRRCRHQ